MKYQATDKTGEPIKGAIFDSEQECCAYERDRARDIRLQAEADRYLELKEWKGKDEAAKKRERTKAETILYGWLAYDARQRPERYEEEEVDEVAVNIVTGAA